jgi:universal stress protein A
MGAGRKDVGPHLAAAIRWLAMARFHILVTTDFSDASLHGLDAASELSQRLDARVTLVHVLQDVPAIPHGAALAPLQHDPELVQQRVEAERRLQALRSRLPSHITVVTSVVAGPQVPATINAQAEQQAADLLVIASRGWNAASGLLLGSTTEQVLRHAKVPTLVIPVSDHARALKLPD